VFSSLETNCLCALDLSSVCDRELLARFYCCISGRVTGAVIVLLSREKQTMDDGGRLRCSLEIEIGKSWKEGNDRGAPKVSTYRHPLSQYISCSYVNSSSTL
jgi:hypothetical protein